MLLFFYGILLLRSLKVYNTKNLHRKTFFALKKKKKSVALISWPDSLILHFAEGCFSLFPISRAIHEVSHYVMSKSKKLWPFAPCSEICVYSM